MGDNRERHWLGTRTDAVKWCVAGVGEHCPGDAPRLIADPAWPCVSSLGTAITKLICINQAKTSPADGERGVPIPLLPASQFARAPSGLREQPQHQAGRRKQRGQRRRQGLEEAWRVAAMVRLFPRVEEPHPADLQAVPEAHLQRRVAASPHPQRPSSLLQAWTSWRGSSPWPRSFTPNSSR